MHAQRFDPRAVTLAAAVAFGLLLASTEWAVLAVAGAWLALAWATCRPDLQFLPTGLALTAIVSLSVFGFGLVSGLGLDTAARRGLRAMLLVLVATWLRSAAGADGLREVSRRALTRLRRLPAMPEAARTLDQIGSEGRLLAAGPRAHRAPALGPPPAAARPRRGARLGVPRVDPFPRRGGRARCTGSARARRTRCWWCWRPRPPWHCSDGCKIGCARTGTRTTSGR